MQGSGPPDKAALPAPGDDHSYFRAIEETFIRLRGAPLLLSPSDWRTAQEWRRRGIPLEVVCRTLEELFARIAEGEGAGRKRIRSLKYCASAVERSWASLRELTAAGERREVPAIVAADRLRALARSLPEDLPGSRELAERIRALGGEVEAVERQLALLDRELIAAAEATLSEADRGELTTAEVPELRQRLPREELDKLRRTLFVRALRRELGLPVLSLFSPEARETA